MATGTLCIDVTRFLQSLDVSVIWRDIVVAKCDSCRLARTRLGMECYPSTPVQYADAWSSSGFRAMLRRGGGYFWAEIFLLAGLLN